MKLNFLKKLIRNLSPEVFRPIPTGVLYAWLQAFSREISGECPWDTGENCYRGYDQFWSLQCRNILCPGYRWPTGLIAYTSRSASDESGAPLFVISGTADEYLSIDNRFDYSSFRYLSAISTQITEPYGDDWVPVGTNGVYVKYSFGVEADSGGFGAYLFGARYFGYNTVVASMGDVQIGDKWYIECLPGQAVPPAIPDPANKGLYGAIATKGTFTGIHKTVYTVQLIDFWGYIQNYQNALLQINLSTCTEEWLDYWGEYFGIKRLFTNIGWENDSAYRYRIMKEITRAKGTRLVLLEEAINYFQSSDVSLIEYQRPPLNPGYNWPGGPWVADAGSSTTKLVDTSASFTAANGFIPGLIILNLTTGKSTHIVSVDSTTEITVEEFNGFFDGDEYSVLGSMDTYNEGSDPDDPNYLRAGLWPYQFYIYPPTLKRPSAKWIRTGSNLLTDAGASPTSEAQVWKIQSSYYYYPFPTIQQLFNVSVVDEVCDDMFVLPAEIGDTIVFGSKYRFSGLKIVLKSEIVKYADDPPSPPPPEHYFSDGTRYEDRVPTDGGVGGTYIWEYWNGNGWTIIKVSDTTTSPTAVYDVPNISLEQDGFVNWLVPSDWVRADDVANNIPSTGTPMYWLRCRIVTAPSVVPEVDYVGIIYAGATLRGTYCATQNLDLSIVNQPALISGIVYAGSDIFMHDPDKNFVAEGIRVGDVIINQTDAAYSIITLISTTINTNDTLNFASLSGGASFDLGKSYAITSYFRPSIYETGTWSGTTFTPASPPLATTRRDANNCYVYLGGSWKVPDWQAGLQDILDRLKTAGTVAIINPRFGG